MKHNYSKIIYEDAKRDKALFVDWSLGNHCNFSCSYCPTNLHDGSALWLSLQECEKFIYNMILHYKTLDKKYFIFGKGATDELAKQLGIPVLGSIPIVEKIVESGDGGLPIVLDENEKVGTEFAKIANNVQNEIDKL